jgi:hypothetical protein
VTAARRASGSWPITILHGGFYESRGWGPDGTAKPWSYGDGRSVMEVRYVRPLTSLPG